MTKKITMWCVINRQNPALGIVQQSLADTKSQAIKAFIKNSGMEWDEWRQKHGYTCELVNVVISTIEPE